MVFFKRASLVMLGLVLMLIASACGGTAPTTTGSTTQNTPAPTPTTAPSTVQTAQATVDGKATTILTNAQGMTLYYFTPDSVAKTACTGDCAKAWPPLVATGTEAPTSSASLPGKLSTITGDNGTQVEYSGYLLYTFANDKAPGDVKGQGIGKKWYVATPDLASVVIRVTTGTVKGKSQTILTNAQSMTLYYFTPDTTTKTACTGQCVQNWPPLMAAGTGTPTADAPLTATLTAVDAGNGSQVECNGHLLYTFAADKAPGDVNGEGVGGKWFVATPDLAKA
ncbi:MAG TPA: hypothetical protein VFN35_09815 [Ktedonobacteraceae bacterium]|nr:hypothetical protein [Ktedonobacteraceae bacterium]